MESQHHLLSTHALLGFYSLAPFAQEGLSRFGFSLGLLLLPSSQVAEHPHAANVGV